MTFVLQRTQAETPALIQTYFQQSEGQWRSERRYYTLPDGQTKEVISVITIRFLAWGSEELRVLAQLHGLADELALTCGAHVCWDSSNAHTERREANGSTLFGAQGNLLYRDRGFATSQPITAEFYFTNPQTLHLRSEYKGSAFEEQIQLIGQSYRTRQTIISRAGEQQMIGQYLEKRLLQDH
ncbi:phycobiliprotein lyase [Anthocerotibacter panamensis]|uniref:phycobiliprotein lyase n=1 Tax=Anthocerotibacter panamensis TaxID=2857077 RepID=UPI001FD95098|nr:phycobiliprotein lyase [Anthocerotibacter panamensis]